MKKSRMLLLFGGLSLILVGYVAWCGRTFYLRAPIPDLGQVPEEARTLALAEIEAADLRRPEKFTMERLSGLLMNPYDSDPPHLRRRWLASEQFLYFDRACRPGEGILLTESVDGWVLYTGQQHP